MSSSLNPQSSILNPNSPPLIMGVLNVTPDSFSDGGKYFSVDKAAAKALQMIEEGANIIDIGGESSRPGSEPISIQEEIDRVLPVIEKLRAETEILISVDTYKTAVMKAVIEKGVDIINDIYALQMADALEIIKDSQTAVCLMHMQGKPQSMQENPYYENVVKEVFDFLNQRVQCCIANGISQDRIIVDPGFGFGKTTQHNLQLLQQLEKFQILNYPVLIGWSRKFSIGDVLKRPVNERLYGGLAAAVLAVYKGARIIRTHDIKETKDAVLFAHYTMESAS